MDFTVREGEICALSQAKTINFAAVSRSSSCPEFILLLYLIAQELPAEDIFLPLMGCFCLSQDEITYILPFTGLQGDWILRLWRCLQIHT